MLDGEKINHSMKTGSMDDVGTRMEHLTQLYELWKTGLDVIERFDKNSPFYEERKTELESSLKLLAYHMEKDYSENSYRQAVDTLPSNAEDFKDPEKS
jgi:hypothetical protein